MCNELGISIILLASKHLYQKTRKFSGNVNRGEST